MAEKTNSYQDYQDAQSQLLQIQAQQQANLQEARLMGQSQMATNNALNQAAQVAAQTVAMGNTTQPATFNPTTQAVLQQYGLGQPRVVRNQTRSQNTTPQHVTINNNTSNITNNNVAVPANIGGPLQGRPVQINPDVQMGTFKTWLSNVFAQQNTEAARRDREYEKRESALARNANKVLKKIGEIGGDIGKALDPRRATSSSVNTIKTLFTVLGIANLAKNWDVVAEKLDGLVNFFKGKSREDGGGDSEKSFFVRMRETLVHLLGGQKEGDNAEGVLIALRRLFYTKDGEDSANGKGIFNLLLDRIKIELKNRFEAASAAAKAYRESNKAGGIGGIVDKAVTRLLGATEAIFKSFISMDSSHVINDSMANTADEVAEKEIDGNYWSNGVKRIKTMDSKKARRDITAKLQYGTEKDEFAMFNYDKDGRLITKENEESIDLKDININNVVDFGFGVNKDSDLHFDPGQFINESGNINIENGDLMGIYLASRDIAVYLLRAYSSSKKFSESIQSALTGIKRLDRVFENNELDRIPVHESFVSMLSSSTLKNLEKRRYKILVRERFKSVNKDKTIISKVPESIGSKTQNSTKYTFVLLPSVGKDDKGDDGTTHMLYTISREDLRNIVNIYTKTDKSNKVYDLQSNEFSMNFAKTAYDNTDAKIKDKEEINEAMAEFKRWYGVNNKEQYLKDLENWQNDVDKSRPKQMAENIAQTEFYNKLNEATGDAGNFISGITDQLTGKLYKKKSEFVENLYEPLSKVLEEEFPETMKDPEVRDRYTKLLLSQLALESGWGKHQSGKNNFGGIKAAKNEDGTPVDEEHAQEYWTKELLDGGPLDYPNLKDRAKPGFPYQATSNKWMWVIKDYFKTYDTPEEFLKDYVQKLKNNWPEAMEGVEETKENLPRYYAMKLKNGKYGPYYTAKEDSYRDSLSSIYKSIEDVQEKIKSKQAIEDDEISTNSDLEKEEQQGISQVRMGSIVEGEGKGDSNYSIPTYNPKYEEYDSLEENIKTYDNTVKRPEFDIDKAISTITEDADYIIDKNYNRVDRKSPDKSSGYCARHVAKAIKAGGINIPRYNAKDYLSDKDNNGRNVMEDNGFEEIQPGNYQKGDISVEEASSGHKYGHMAMYDGTRWISDFKQTNPQGIVHSDVDPKKIHYFRYTGRTIANGTIIHDNGTSTTSEINYKKEFEDDLLSRLSSAFHEFADLSRKGMAENEGAGDANNSSENYEKLLEIVSQIAKEQQLISYNTAATADEVRTNTEITAQQINRPIETRGTSSSMLNNRMNSNYGG